MFAGVVTMGTGVRARLDGYSAAGKTGTAQKIDATGSYSDVDFIVSFAGFAPVINPAVTVIVTLDSPRGEERDGGLVAAPVFRRIAGQTLTYLNVPGDLPGSPPPLPPPGPSDRVAVSSWQDRAGGEARLEGIRLAGSLDRAGVLRVQDRAPQRAETIITRDSDSVVVPDFSGLMLRGVVSRCARLGLEAVTAGSGVAVSQSLKAGARVPRGSRVRIELKPVLPRAPTRAM